MVKDIRNLLDNFFEYHCLSIIVNINSFSDWNITVNTTLKYFNTQALNKN